MKTDQTFLMFRLENQKPFATLFQKRGDETFSFFIPSSVLASVANLALVSNICGLTFDRFDKDLWPGKRFLESLNNAWNGCVDTKYKPWQWLSIVRTQQLPFNLICLDGCWWEVPENSRCWSSSLIFNCLTRICISQIGKFTPIYCQHAGEP